MRTAITYTEHFMLTDRRAFITAVGVLATGVSQGSETAAQTGAKGGKRIKAVVFDGFPIIDPRPVAARAEMVFPGKGEALTNAWRTRQFEYTWLRTLSGSYADFWQTTQEALVFAATSLGLPMAAAARDALMHTYLELKAWDDARPALEALRGAGIRIAFLSNFTAAMLDAAVENSGLQGFFGSHLTTDRVRAFKPDHRAYEMGLRAFRARREEIVFCAAAGWDAAGAKSFGYPTFWVNRTRQPAEELGVKADAEGTSLADLVRFVLANA
jgi:2-haloacid dehalogenase